MSGPFIAAGISRHAASPFIECPVGHQASPLPGQLVLHLFLNLRLAASHAPHANLIHLPRPFALRPIGREHQIARRLAHRSHAGLASLLHTIPIHPHEVALLTGHEREVLPRPCDGIRRPVGETSRAPSVPKLPAHRPVLPRHHRTDSVMRIARLQREDHRARIRIRPLPKLDRNLVGGNDQAEVGHPDRLSGIPLKRQRVTRCRACQQRCVQSCRDHQTGENYAGEAKGEQWENSRSFRGT